MIRRVLSPYPLHTLGAYPAVHLFDIKISQYQPLKEMAMNCQRESSRSNIYYPCLEIRLTLPNGCKKVFFIDATTLTKQFNAHV